MLEREDLRQVRSVVKDVLREGQLDKLPDLFGREHHKHRGTHDLTFRQLVDTPDYIDNRQFITIVNEAGTGITFVDLLGVDHQIVVTKNPHDITLGLHHQVHIYSDEEAPRARISNLSDTLELDPVLQFGLGADDNVKFTQGVDDSDSDAWLLCSGDILTSAVTAEEYGLSISYDGTLLVADSNNDRIKKHLSSDLMTYVSKVGSSGSGNDQFNNPWAICTDGWYVYVLDSSNHRVVKRLLSDFSYVSQVGSLGSGDNQFNNPRGMCTDGVYLYIADGNNERVVKRLCSDLTFVDKTDGSEGLNGPRSICTDGHYLYLFRYAGATYVRFKLLCSTLGVVQRELTDGQDVHTWAGMCYAGGYIYACTTSSIHKYAASNLSYVSEWGAAGTGDGQFTSAEGITTDGTHLWITDIGGIGGSQRIQKYLLDGTFVAKYGTYGSGDTQFYSLRGICIGGTITDISYVSYRAPILKAGLDGSYVDAYPLLRARDGFQLMEDGTVGATDYVGLYAPAAITTSYHLTFPGTGPAAVGHLAVSAAGVLSFGQNVGTTGSPTFVRIVSLSQAIGTAPITVTSTTVCANLNAGMVDGYHHDQSLLAAAGPSFDHVHLTVAIGTAPLVVTSTTMVSNLNADLLDGYHASGVGAVIDHGSLLDLSADDHPQYLILAGRGGTYQSILGGVTAKPGSTYGYTLAFGINALSSPSLETWTDNTAYGSLALQACTSGYDNVAVGYKVLMANTTGHLNTGIGTFCFSNNVTGHRNCAFGASSLELLTGGDDNMGFGYNTLRSNLTGSRNFAAGTYALYNSTGSDNFAFGYRSGFTRTSGDGCVFLGNYSGYYETGSNALFIDNAQRASEADGRAKALIYGIFAAATVNQYLYINGKINTPEQMTSTLAIGTSPFAVTSTTVCANFNADLWDGYQFADYLDQAVKIASTPTFGGIIIANGGTIGQAAGPLLNFDDTNNYLEISGCNVGIGATAPGEILDIVQNCPNNDGVFLRVYESGAGGTVGKVLIGVFKEPGGTYSLPGIWFGTDAPSYTNYVFLTDGTNQIINTPAGKNIKFRVNNADIMAIIGNTGRVGINDNAPGELLDVNGNINLTGVLKIDDVQVLSELAVSVPEVKTNTTTPADLTITTGAAKTLVLGTAVYKDINTAGYLLAKPASSAPGVDTFRSAGGTDTTIETYAFAIGELVHGGFELQHDYLEGTDLVFHVHWQGIAAPAGGTDNVQWRLNYIVARGGVTLAAATAIDSPDVAIDTQYRCYRSDFAAIVGTTFKIGDQFLFTLTRVAAVSDDYAGDCLIQTAGIHYQVDTLGSRAIGTK